jgi:DUF1365 family protein
MFSYLVNSRKNWEVEHKFGSTTSYGTPACQLSIEVLAVLCLGALSRKIGPLGSSDSHAAATVLGLVCLWNRQAALERLSTFTRLEGTFRLALAVGTSAVVAFLFLYCSQQPRGLLSPSDSSASPAVVQNSGLQLRLIPCRTTHARLSPTTHSFSYFYLYAGIPIGLKDCFNTLLSADTTLLNSEHGNLKTWKAWFTVEGDDHLQRTTSTVDLLQKLHCYLKSQDIAHQLYPFVYLVTAPRFLGFSFNPVSFWYLYSEQRQLTAMILEVNNTFDERRMYFLERRDVPDKQASAEKDILTHSWPKDFHVSPFNDREGNYSLKARDPFAPNMCGDGYIDNTITLSSPDGRPKVVARVFSTQRPILASKVNRIQALRFVSSWWWVGFMTNVRILSEARKLWMKSLRVFYRPEVMNTSIGRRATVEENVLAENFLEFLRYVQRHPAGNFSLRYTAAAGKTQGTPISIDVLDDLTGGISESLPIVDLHVLTPAFYASIVQFSDVAQGLNDLCRSKPENERLANLSEADVFLRQIAALVSSNNTKSLPTGTLRNCSILEAARRPASWRSLVLFFSTWPCIQRTFYQHHQFQPSSIDVAVFGSDSMTRENGLQYSQMVIYVILAKKLALGSTSLLRFYQNVVRFTLLWLVAGRVQAMLMSLPKGVVDQSASR